MFGLKQPGKRLFGSMAPPGRSPHWTPPIAPEMAPQGQIPAGIGMDAMPQRKPGLGTRLFGRGWEDKAFALGGILQGDPRGAMIMHQRKDAQAQAAAELAAEQRKRAEGLADWQFKEQWKLDNPAPTGPDLREDNAGNVWQFDARTGRPIGEKPVWVDPTEKVIYQDGMQIRVPNPYRGGASGIDDQPAEEDGYVYTPGAGGRANKDNWKPKGGGGGGVTSTFLDGL